MSVFFDFCKVCLSLCFPETEETGHVLPTHSRRQREYSPLKTTVREPIETSLVAKLRNRVHKKTPDIRKSDDIFERCIELQNPVSAVQSIQQVQEPEIEADHCPYRYSPKRYSTLLGFLNLETDMMSEQSLKLKQWIIADLHSLACGYNAEPSTLSFNELSICIKYRLFDTQTQWLSIINLISPLDWSNILFHYNTYFAEIGVDREIGIEIFSKIVENYDIERLQTLFSSDANDRNPRFTEDIAALKNNNPECYDKIHKALQT